MDAEQPVETMEISRRDLAETVQLVASIAANESAELRPEIPGTITAILFEEGKPVRQGEPLATLDRREIEAQLAETRASFQLAEQNLRRNQSLLEDDAVSRLEVDASLAEHARLRAGIDLLEVRLAKSTLTAPFDGTAGSRSVSVGDYIDSQTILTRIEDLSRLKVEMQVPERFTPNLRPGTPFTLNTTHAENPAEIIGTVYFVSPRIDEATRSTLVKGHIENPPAHLKPGMFANVTLTLRTIPDALVVPETAILTTPRGTVVVSPRKSEDGSHIAEFIPVITGLRIPGWVQITPAATPIQAGDPIVSAGVGGLILFPGMKLRPVTPVVTAESPAETDRNIPPRAAPQKAPAESP